MTKILYTSEAIRLAVRDIFGKGSGRRVAVVAFVGAGAEAYLPDPEGLDLYCWPSPSGTSASELRALKRRGVKIHFAPRLHMKVYWSARRGVVVTSANLSTNAYGRGDLREFGVHLPSRAVDIDKIIRSISAVPATPETVDKLERDRRKLIARGPDTRRGLPTFVDWYDERTRTLDWSIITYEGSVRASRELRAVAKRDRPDGGLENWVTFARGEIAEDDYLLTIDTTGDRLTDADWMYVHRIVGVGRNDPTYDRHLRYQAGQVYPSRTCRPPPFRIDDRFRRALREAPRTLKPPLAETLLWLRGRPPLGLLRALRGLY